MSGLKALQEATGDKSWEDLGEAVQGDLTLKEWMWLSDAEKARYVQTATEPEGFVDGS
jgi:hypothetical protein